jgi:alpha-mannosidase
MGAVMDVVQMYRPGSVERIEAVWNTLLMQCGVDPREATFELRARHDILVALGWDGSDKLPDLTGRAVIAGLYYRDLDGNGAFTPGVGEKLSATLLGVPTLEGPDAPQVTTYLFTFVFAPVRAGQTYTLRFDVEGVAPFETTVTAGEGLTLCHLPIAPTKPLTYVVPHSHFDPEWRSFYEEYLDVSIPNQVGRIELLRSQPSQCFNLDEEASTRPMLERRPEVTDELRQHIKDGVIEPKGIVSAGELVLPHGEAILRQLTVGEQVLSAFLGIDVHPETLWSVDNYGICYQLPQIMVKAGRRYFYCGEYNHHRGMKFVPSDQPFADNRAYELPEFWLEGPDGSRVLVQRSPYFFHPFGPRVPAEELLGHQSWFTPYGGDFSGPDPELPAKIQALNSPDGESRMPARGEEEAHNVDNPWTFQPWGMSNYIVATSQQFFDAVARDPDVPTLKTDSRIGMWTGSYESRILGRQRNRRVEMLLLATETLSTAAHQAGMDEVYDALHEIWYTLLINNHHDPQLCMMGPEALFDEVLERYDLCHEMTANVLNASLDYLAADIKTNTGDGTPVVVFNPHAWECSRVVHLWLDDWEHVDGKVHVKDFDGNCIPSDVLTCRHTGKRYTLFHAANLPAAGWRTYYLTDASCGCPQALSVDANHLENEHLRVELTDGLIQRIIEKGSDKTVFEARDEASVGELFVFKDEGCIAQIRPVAEEFMQTAQVVARSSQVPRRVVVNERSSARVSVEIECEMDGCLFTQRFMLSRDARSLDIETFFRWDASHVTPGDGRRVRMALPTALTDAKVIHDVPFAVMDWHQGDEIQPTTSFLAIADADETIGAAMIHDGVCSQQVSGDIMWQSLFRSVRMPGELNVATWDPPCGWDIDGDVALDEGGHSICQRLMVYSGSWREAHVPREAAVFQTPQLIRCASQHSGEQSGEFWNIDVEPAEIVQVMWKRADYSDASIVRLVNPTDQAVQGKLRLNFPVGAVEEVNFREEAQMNLAVEHGEIDLTFTPYEIKTIRLAATE